MLMLLRKDLVMQKVELKPIPVSPNQDYLAGSDGQIYSRTKYKGFGRKEYVDWYPLKGHRQKGKGYMIISLCHDSKRVTRSIHRLVCMAFHGMPEKKSTQVRHLDGNPSNNKPENLKWGTQIENWQDRKAHGRGCEGEKHPMAKLTDEECQHLRWAIKSGLCSQRQAARALQMSQGGIWHIVNIR
jgi:hypothetical protein